MIAILVLAGLTVLSGFSYAYAASEALTLEQAVKLAYENSRSLKKHELNLQKTKYQLYDARDQYDQAGYATNAQLNRYFSLSSEYSRLQQEYNEDDDSVLAMNEIAQQMDALWRDIERQAETNESLWDKKQDAEDRYEDAVAAEEEYRKQLKFLVEELYSSILIQEQSLLALNREYDLRRSLLDIEKTKLQLGRSTRPSVDQLSISAGELNKEIAELKALIRNSKGKLNDLLGRKYDDELTLSAFEIKEEVEIPEYEALLAGGGRNYSGFSVLKRDIKKLEDDLDSASGYQYSILKLELEQKRLQLRDEEYKLAEKVSELVNRTKSKQAEYQLSLVTYKNAKNNYDWDLKRFETGRLSKVDLMRSELACFNAMNRYLSTGYGYYLACRSLELAAAGIL